MLYRAFTRIDAGEVPDAKTILKIAGTLGPEIGEQLHRHVVESPGVPRSLPADMTLWTPALDRHIATDRPRRWQQRIVALRLPPMKRRRVRGVRPVVLPRAGPKTPARRAHERPCLRDGHVGLADRQP